MSFKKVTFVLTNIKSFFKFFNAKSIFKFFNAKSIFKNILFSNLHRQVVIISSASGLSPLYRQLIIVAFVLELTHHLAVSTSLYYDFSAYFEIDIFFGQLFYQTVAFKGKYFNFFFCLEAFFTMRLFVLLYLNSDQVVWSHLRDLIVRNRVNINFNLWNSQTHSKMKFKVFQPGIKIVHTSSKLYHYPHLKQKLRTHCALVSLIFEILTAISLTFYYISFFFILLSVSITLLKVKHLFTSFQLFFSLVVILQILPIIYMVIVMYFLVALTLYLVCHVYLNQFRAVNRKLLDLTKKKEIRHNFDIFSSVYRAFHIRLTTFILHYNNSTVSHIIASYLNLVVPVYAFSPVLLYFQSSHLPDSFVRNLSLGFVINYLVLIVLTLAVARVNSEIRRSGPKLGSIFAGRKIKAKTQIKKQCNWFENCGSNITFGSKEALKLSTFYEMIWRTEKELAFTAGRMNRPMNWRFIYEVS